MTQSAPGARSKRCTVAYATRERQHVWEVDLPLSASVGDALEAARASAAVSGEDATIPWDSAAVGIFGEPCARTDGCADGDRIELYRPLRHDPRERRRERVQRERRARKASAS
jgi:putative ubiquitin-RnfH superfamily antitoxin RatB of RatAB toxin-antitoxin module